MTQAPRLLTAIAALLGAAGVVLAALAAHHAEGARLAPASTMLLFHACAAILATLAVRAALVHGVLGLIAAAGFILGAALFAGDLSLRAFAGHALAPMAAPTGGTLLIVAWLVFAVAALVPRKS
jgi:uncharacterized membrane protein YgdD (TMEM256/DUF423 family)